MGHNTMARRAGSAHSRSDDGPQVAPSVLAQRRGRLLPAMRSRDLAALVVYGNPSIFGIATRTHGHLRYLCAWTDRFAPSVLVVPLDPR